MISPKIFGDISKIYKDLLKTVLSVVVSTSTLAELSYFVIVNSLTTKTSSEMSDNNKNNFNYEISIWKNWWIQ